MVDIHTDTQTTERLLNPACACLNEVIAIYGIEVATTIFIHQVMLNIVRVQQ